MFIIEEYLMETIMVVISSAIIVIVYAKIMSRTNQDEHEDEDK